MISPQAENEAPAGKGMTLPANISEDQIKRIISVTGNLPPVPHVAAKMMELVGDEGTSVKELQKVISADPALTARILKMANSVFYSFDQKISTLSHAIVILGFRAVQSMAIAASSRSLFVKKGAEFGLKERLLWEHSIGCAMGCRQVSRMISYEQEETAFIAGLLHDIGKAVLNQVIPKKYGRIVEKVYNDRKPFAEIESEMLGFDHSHIGALIAQKWNFSWDMVEAIAYHHSPDAVGSGGGLSAILAVSNEICKRMGVGLEKPTEDPPPISENWGAAALSAGRRDVHRDPGDPEDRSRGREEALRHLARSRTNRSRAAPSKQGSGREATGARWNRTPTPKRTSARRCPRAADRSARGRSRGRSGPTLAVLPPAVPPADPLWDDPDPPGGDPLHDDPSGEDESAEPDGDTLQALRIIDQNTEMGAQDPESEVFLTEGGGGSRQAHVVRAGDDQPRGRGVGPPRVKAAHGFGTDLPQELNRLQDGSTAG